MVASYPSIPEDDILEWTEEGYAEGIQAMEDAL